MKKTKNIISGFTLIELMVVIAIIAILALSATNMSFNKISNKEKLINYNNKIISTIETIRNDSLMGKGIGSNLDIPKFWRIDFSKAGSGKILIYYNTGVLDIFSREKSIIFDNGFYINSITCSNLTGTWQENTGTGIIFISGNNITGSGDLLCNDTRVKKIEIVTGYKSLTGSILINTVNGLIE